MEKHQIDLFKAIKSNNIEKARKAYEKGANINWPLDRWMIGGRQHWGLRVQVKPFGIYLGFSARESWACPDGEEVNRGDTLIMVALKCQMREVVAFLVGCDRLNLNCRNEAGNTAADIARSTGQALLMNHGSDVNPAYVEAVPQWEQGMHTEAAGVGVGATSVTMYASVVGEAMPPGPGVKPTAPIYPTAEPVMVMATTVNPESSLAASQSHQGQPYNNTTNSRAGGRGGAVYGNNGFGTF